MPQSLKQWGSVPSKQTIIKLCLSVLVANILLMLVLGGAGILKTTERGDITYHEYEERPSGDIHVPENSNYHFVVEQPTDADAFYNAVIRVWSGGPLYNTWSPDTAQEFHYAPITFYLFAILSLFGYVEFKFLFFFLSLSMTVIGSYLLLQAEIHNSTLDIDQKSILLLSLLSVGFSPMVANYKVGQVTPLVYGVVGALWYLYRHEHHASAGALLSIATFLKPYFMVPLVLFFRLKSNYYFGVIGFSVSLLIGNLVSAAVFGPEVTIQYYNIILSSLLEESPEVEPITHWSVETIKPFWFMGELSVVGRLVSAVPVTLATLYYARTGRGKVGLFALSITMIFTLLESPSLIDAGLLLAPIVVLGVHLYQGERCWLGILAVTFFLLHAHTYVMEILIGDGHPTVTTLISAHPVLKAAQPGIYGVAILYCLSVHTFLTETSES